MMLNHINKEIQIDTTEIKMFIDELCSKISGLKLLDRVRVDEKYDNYFTIKDLPAPEGEHKDAWYENDIMGYRLTFNGLTNAVVWIKVTQNRGYSDTITYYYHTPVKQIKSVGDRHTIKSVRINTLMRKITKHRLPTDDMQIFGGGGDYSYNLHPLSGCYDFIIDDATTQSAFEDVVCTPKEYHKLLIMNNNGTAFENYSIYEKHLDKFNRLQKQLEEKEKESQKLFSKPVTIILKDSLMIKNQGVVITGSLSMESKAKFDATKKLHNFNTALYTAVRINDDMYMVLQNTKVKFFEDITDFDDVTTNDILGRLTMYRMTIQAKYNKLILGNTMSYLDRYESDKNYYDDALRMLYLSANNRTTESNSMLFILESHDK